MNRARLLFCLTLMGCAAPAEALRSLSPCKTGYVEWDERPLAEIVEASDVIFLGRVDEFVKDDSRNGYDGYYLVGSALGVDMKGKTQGRVKIYGSAPYPYPPQSYFQVDQKHASLNEDTVYWGRGGETGIWTERKNGVLIEGSHCPLLPRFVIGYDYLMMFGTESRMSFEPIHSIMTDNWYKLVEKTVRSLEK